MGSSELISRFGRVIMALTSQGLLECNERHSMLNEDQALFEGGDGVAGGPTLKISTKRFPPLPPWATNAGTQISQFVCHLNIIQCLKRQRLIQDSKTCPHTILLDTWDRPSSSAASPNWYLMQHGTDQISRFLRNILSGAFSKNGQITTGGRIRNVAIRRNSRHPKVYSAVQAQRKWIFRRAQQPSHSLRCHWSSWTWCPHNPQTSDTFPQKTSMTTTWKQPRLPMSQPRRSPASCDLHQAQPSHHQWVSLRRTLSSHHFHQRCQISNL